MPPKPTIPSFDALLAAIAAAASQAVLSALAVTARTYFAGTQREELETAVAHRGRELSIGDTLGG